MTLLTIVSVLILLLAALWLGRSNTGAGRPSVSLTLPQQQLAGRLQAHVVQLAETIGERNLWRYPQLQLAADYISAEFSRFGYAVTAQTYTVNDKEVRNLAVEIVGRTRPDEILLVGAHYDSVLGTPGANDNASGVAALLELARTLADHQPAVTIRLVAFVNEEPPYFKTAQMGSWVYAQSARRRGEQIIGMLCLETIGYYDQEERSQHYPLPLMRLFYPSAGNYLTFVTNLSSHRLLQQSLAAFRRQSEFPVQGLVAPSALPGVDWSDHWSFWQIGVPAIMLTDTAPYRYPHYHSEQDRADRLKYPEFARAVDGLIGMIKTLAR